jgi:hypothetical protein
MYICGDVFNSTKQKKREKKLLRTKRKEYTKQKKIKSNFQKHRAWEI